MKKLLLNILLFFQKKSFQMIIISSIAWGCTDNEVTIINEPKPSSMEKLNALFDDATVGEKKFAHFNPAQSFTYTSERGTTVTVQPNSLTLNGTAVTGTVILELVEIYDKAKMSITNKPSMGLLPNKEWEIMQSGGEFYVNVVTLTGQNLTLTKPIEIATSASNTGGMLEGMKLFKGSITDNNLGWEQTATVVFTDIKANTYKFSVTNFGWFNVDKFYGYPEPKTLITAKVPVGFDKVSQVLVLPKNTPNALGTLGGKYPVGLQCYLIFVTENNGNYLWITNEETLTPNHTATFDIKKAKAGKKADWQGHVTLLK
jgi:hypothetical protein